MTKCDEEIERCRTILDKLNATPTNTDEISTLKAEIAELKQLLTKQAEQVE